MTLTPVDLSQQLLLHLGVYARPLALFGALAVLIAIGGLTSALAGDVRLVSRVRRRARSLAFARMAAALLALGYALFAAFRPTDPAPTALFAALFVGCVVALPARPPLRAARVPASDGTRGAFLLDSARILGATALLVALLVAEPWYRGFRLARRGGGLFDFRTPRARRPGFDIPGLTAEVTPPSQFYYLTKNLVDPDLSVDGWALRVGGLVAHPFAIGFDALLTLPRRDRWVTQECVSNPVGGPLISCGLFSGVSLRSLLLRAGPLPSATKVVMRAPDGHADSIPLAIALGPDVLVAYGLDGAFLTRAHGFPARILIPGSYGFKSIKWVTQIELVAHAFKGTWQELGWTDAATVQTMARIDVARVSGRDLLVAGVAFAGARGVLEVQVRVDGGPWISAGLHSPPLSPLTWTQWRVIVPGAGDGRHTVTARAIDGTGVLQDPRQRDIYPAGATGYHQVTV